MRPDSSLEDWSYIARTKVAVPIIAGSLLDGFSGCMGALLSAAHTHHVL